MEKVKLGEYVKIRTGKLDANASSENGQYPFFTCSSTPLKIDTYSYDCECVLLAGNGDLNVKYYNGKFDAYQRTYIIESADKEKLIVPYLYCFLDKYVETLRVQSIGGVIKYIKLGNLTEAIIPLPNIEKQAKIVEKLDKVSGLIEKLKTQLEKLAIITEIELNTFYGCSSLEIVHLPAGVSNFEIDSFKDCRNLKAIYVPEDKVDYYKEHFPVDMHWLIVEEGSDLPVKP